MARVAIRPPLPVCANLFRSNSSLFSSKTFAYHTREAFLGSQPPPFFARGVAVFLSLISCCLLPSLSGGTPTRGLVASTWKIAYTRERLRHINVYTCTTERFFSPPHTPLWSLSHRRALSPPLFARAVRTKYTRTPAGDKPDLPLMHASFAVGAVRPALRVDVFCGMRSVRRGKPPPRS